MSPRSDELEFFHIKLESHDVIYAEGVRPRRWSHVDKSAVNFADYLAPIRNPRHGGSSLRPGRSWSAGVDELKSRFRSALSPLIDLRNQADVVRDRLEERGILPALADAS